MRYNYSKRCLHARLNKWPKVNEAPPLAHAVDKRVKSFLREMDRACLPQGEDDGCNRPPVESWKWAALPRWLHRAAVGDGAVAMMQPVNILETSFEALAALKTSDKFIAADWHHRLQNEWSACPASYAEHVCITRNRSRRWHSRHERGVRYRVVSV